jgi:GntR family transcriptional repressor for pyruvate dehydrogenase complex
LNQNGRLRVPAQTCDALRLHHIGELGVFQEKSTIRHPQNLNRSDGDRNQDLMKLTPISRTTLGEQVASQLAAMISTGKWKPGEKLPSESELRQTLHIGRSTLREALRSLSYVGLIVIKPGDGTYVEHRSAQPIHGVLTQGKLRTQEDVDDLFETRIILETELVALCARRASTSDLQKIETFAIKMEETMDQPHEKFASLDIQFHLAIADASRNRILGRLFHSIHGLIEEMLAKREYILGGHEGTCLSHRKVLQALVERDAEGARNAMREHLDGFIANYLREHLADSSPKDKTRALKDDALPPLQTSISDAVDVSAAAALPRVEAS